MYTEKEVVFKPILQPLDRKASMEYKANCDNKLAIRKK